MRAGEKASQTETLSAEVATSVLGRGVVESYAALIGQFRTDSQPLTKAGRATSQTPLAPTAPHNLLGLGRNRRPPQQGCNPAGQHTRGRSATAPIPAAAVIPERRAQSTRQSGRPTPASPSRYELRTNK